jgi:hypothetical protein
MCENLHDLAIDAWAAAQLTRALRPQGLVRQGPTVLGLHQRIRHVSGGVSA